MDRTPVTSSNLRAVGYDPASQMLEVEFNNGKVYRYDGVTVEEHAELMAAESIGRCFAAGVKKRHSGVLVQEV